MADESTPASPDSAPGENAEMDTVAEAFRRLTRAMADGVVVVDRDGHIRYASPGAEALLGRTEAELSGLLLGLPVGSQEPSEVVVTRGKETLIPAELRVVEATWAGEPVLVATFRDISDRLRAEEATRQLNEELERLVEERTRSLVAANEELEAFNYAVSHDMASPLRAIRAYCHRLEEDAVNVLGEDASMALARIVEETRSLSSMVQALLNLSRATTRPLEKEEVDLTALAREVTEGLSRETPGEGPSVSLAPTPAAMGSPDLLIQVLENLLGNAWKYSSNEAEAVISFDALEEDGATVYRVKDNGVGFDMARAGELFMPFRRLHEPEFPGTGIGLNTVKRIVERHGGRIWLESEPGVGTEVFFTLGGR